MADVGGRTTKRTYVTTYTTDVDPRTLPDFASRGIATGSDEENSRMHPRHHNSNTIRGGSDWQDDSHRPPRGHAGTAAAPAHTQRGAPAPLPMPPQPHYHASSPSPPSSVADSVDGHRLRKKYTTTTVTTITTTTVLLPTMQEAYVFPSVTSHCMDQQTQARPAITDGNGYPTGGPQQKRVYQVDSSHASSTSASPDRHSRQQQQQLQSSGADVAVRGNGRLLPARPQYRPDGSAAQSWVFHQQSARQVDTEEGRARLPTLAELGITSYFGTEGESGRGQQQQQQLRAAPYAAAPARGAGPQPWVATETRHEVEVGRRYN